LGERLTGSQKVDGSIPFSSTEVSTKNPSVMMDFLLSDGVFDSNPLQEVYRLDTNSRNDANGIIATASTLSPPSSGFQFPFISPSQRPEEIFIYPNDLLR
jgi:hypothetical protein